MALRSRQWIVLTLILGVVASASAAAHRKARAKETTLPRISLAQIAEGKAYGVKTAPVRIDEFSDFECPACRELYLGTLRQLIDQDVSSGKVYLVVHDFPLQMHRFSHKAAFYGDAAAAIGRYGRVEEALFSNQPQWATDGNILPFIAKTLSPTELKQLEKLAQTKEIQDAVQKDVEMGQKANVRQTPTMFVTYKGRRTPLVGVISYTILHHYIDALLHQ